MRKSKSKICICSSFPSNHGGNPNKRGQLTIFIIVAILIIAGIALFLTLKDKKVSSETNYPPQVVPIVNYVQQCLDETAEDAIKNISMQGGYYSVPNPKKEFSTYDVPFYWNVNKSLMPSEEIIENEFSRYVEENLQNCIKDFEIFKEKGYSIKQGNISVNSKLFSDKIAFELNYPLFITKGGYKGEIDKIKEDFSTNFYEKYLIVKEIMAEQEKNPNSIPLGFIINLANKEDFQFDTINLEQNVVIYSLTFNPGEINEFKYIFINKYSKGNLE